MANHDVIVANVGLHYTTGPIAGFNTTWLEGDRPAREMPSVVSSYMRAWARAQPTGGQSGPSDRKALIWRETTPTHFLVAQPDGSISDLTGMMFTKQFKGQMCCSRAAAAPSAPQLELFRSTVQNAISAAFDGRLIIYNFSSLGPPGHPAGSDQLTELSNQDQSVVYYLPFMDVAAARGDLHLAKFDCAHYCYSPGLWEPLIRAIAAVARDALFDDVPVQQ